MMCGQNFGPSDLFSGDVGINRGIRVGAFSLNFLLKLSLRIFFEKERKDHKDKLFRRHIFCALCVPLRLLFRLEYARAFQIEL
jgi:hypothetical protein